MFCKQYH